MKTNPNDSAFPEIYTDIDVNNPDKPGDTYSTGGMTKREYFAAKAMQGMLTNELLSGPEENEAIAKDAVNAADKLIAELNKTAKS